MAGLLGIKSVIIHKYSSILSAYGMDLAELTDELSTPTSEVYSSQSAEALLLRAEDLKSRVIAKIHSQGVPESMIDTDVYFSMRLKGTDTNLMIRQPHDDDFAGTFMAEFKREFGYVPDQKIILVDAVRVRGSSKTQSDDALTPFAELKSIADGSLPLNTPHSEVTSPVYFKKHGWVQSPIFNLNDLESGWKIKVRSRPHQWKCLKDGTTTNQEFLGTGYDHRQDPDAPDSARVHRYSPIAPRRHRHCR